MPCTVSQRHVKTAFRPRSARLSEIRERLSEDRTLRGCRPLYPILYVKYSSTTSVLFMRIHTYIDKLNNGAHLGKTCCCICVAWLKVPSPN